MTITEQLHEVLGSRCVEYEPMAKHTNFRIGGPAKWFTDVRTLEELQRVLSIAKEHQIKIFVFGGGSNLLFSDEGFDGIVIKMAMRTYEIQGTQVRADSGVLSSALARATAMLGLKGFQWAITLPGTIGGGVRGNAGCFGGEMKDHLVSVQVLRENQIIELTQNDLQFGYRESAIKHSTDIVLSATFELEEGDVTELKMELDDKLMKRKISQPLGAGSAGCMFKNYEIQSDEELQRLMTKLDIPSEMQSRRQLSAGWLIDNLDLKGKKIGDAQVSEVHGNFVVNTGSATADEVMQLVALIKTRARNEYGILLQEEIMYVGF
ncbi:UDP-N-acetylmuramate dehydrogenase [Candidatus Uhrbacteria bacterium]|nr:UDP-N-acetylmuramate dehydrogenase [Candidatus Uhrbacteria bacterium]